MDVTNTHGCEPHECEDTRERILSAAQKLFAEKGYDSTSVRDITTDAECNVASVNYHFGGKENLYLETFRATLKPLREQRLLILGELLDRSPAPALEEFLESFAEGFIDPLVDQELGQRFMALVTREMFDPRLPREVFLSEFIQPVMERALAALEKSGPPMAVEDARLCLMAMVGQLLHALKAHHLFTHDGTAVVPGDIATYIPHFVRFAAGGIRACSESTVPELEGVAASEVVT